MGRRAFWFYPARPMYDNWVKHDSTASLSDDDSIHGLLTGDAIMRHVPKEE